MAIDNEYGFADVVSRNHLELSPLDFSTLQINLTKMCNQACLHCHVDSSPRRREALSDEGIVQCLNLLDQFPEINTVDLTGGAPELHPGFRAFVQSITQRDRRVIVRHNLTVTLDPHPLTKESQVDLPDFFAAQRVEVVSSLPYYEEFFTNKQRGDGVFQKSIESLRMLNARGYGRPGTGLTLNLVYNPAGAFLPAPQAQLEADFKRELALRYDISFNGLFVITNMPIHRFKAQLRRAKTYDAYMQKLVAAFNPDAARGVMCRSMVSVSYEGNLYDCDFNQMLEMKIGGPEPITIFNFSREAILNRKIQFADHCFGCTAGAGSSCGGTTAEG